MTDYIKITTNNDSWNCECCGEIYDKHVIFDKSYTYSFSHIIDSYEVCLDGHFGNVVITHNLEEIKAIESTDSVPVPYYLNDVDYFPDSFKFVFFHFFDNKFTLDDDYNDITGEYSIKVTDNTNGEILYYNPSVTYSIQDMHNIIQLLQQKDIFITVV